MEKRLIMVALKADRSRKGIVLNYDKENKRLTVKFPHATVEGHLSMFVPLVYGPTEGHGPANLFTVAHAEI